MIEVHTDNSAAWRNDATLRQIASRQSVCAGDTLSRVEYLSRPVLSRPELKPHMKLPPVNYHQLEAAIRINCHLYYTDDAINLKLPLT